MLPSQQIKMGDNYVQNEKCFRCRLGLSRHFDGLIGLATLFLFF
jgi:hypothetical protein